MFSASPSTSSGHRIDRDLVYLFRCGGGDFFDIHAAFARCHEDDALGTAVHHHAGVQLLPDVCAFLDKQTPHLLAFRSRLMGFQLHAEDGRRVLAHFIERARELDPPPLPRPPAWICALTTHAFPPSLRAASSASSNREARDRARRRHAILAQNLFRLIFVNLHLKSIGRAGRAPSGPGAPALRKPRSPHRESHGMRRQALTAVNSKTELGSKRGTPRIALRKRRPPQSAGDSACGAV